MNFILVIVASVIISSAIILLARIIYVQSTKNPENSKRRSQAAKTLIILGSGGHTTEMLRVVKNLNLQQYSPRIYVHAQTDRISSGKISEVERANGDYGVIEISRSREVGQSYQTSVWTTLVSFKHSLKIVWTEKPDLILCNGPGTCVPICVAAFMMKLAFMKQTKIIFIESFCRVKTYSLTGKILYHIADSVIVQWPQLWSIKDKHNMCDIAPLTGSQIPWDILVENVRDNIPVEMRIHLTPLCNELRSTCESNDSARSISPCWIRNSLLRLEACLDQTWEALNTGYWKEVALDHRYCYTICSGLKCIFLEIESAASERRSDTEKRERLTEIIKQVDKAILLGAPLENGSDLMTTMASRLNEALSSSASESTKYHEISSGDSGISKDLLLGFVWIARLESPSMESFYNNIFKPKRPAVLEGCLSHWRALEMWKNMDYLMRIAGNRTVPIEIGSRYTEEDWSQSLVTFADFLRSHFSKEINKVGYLAQHQLFEQIPELRGDFSIPDYCTFSDGDDDATTPDINAWFGPRGTLSPLHFDPKNNLLCQIFGWKRVILYRPEESPNLYPYETRLLSNTAQVDPLNPDFVKWPKFEKSRGSMCYLGPGDMLFIPPGWWHHVESLASSFSISFWWC